MGLDPLHPVAPAAIKALLLPVGQIKAERFAEFSERLGRHNVVQLRDVKADGRPHRNMFSPSSFPDGAITYDLISHVPSASHLALAPFDLYREPLAVIAVADGKELQDKTFSKRHSANGTGPTVVQRNIRALTQELEDLRDNYHKVLVHKVLIFDYELPDDSESPIPEGLARIPPIESCTDSTLQGVMSDISSLVVAEMTTAGKSYEAMTAIESPGQYNSSRHVNGASWFGDGPINGFARRNSQFASPHDISRSASASGLPDRGAVRMSMPPVPTRTPLTSSNSTPGLGRPSTPVKGGPPPGSDGVMSPSTGPSTPEQKPGRPDTSEGSRDGSRDRVSVHGFGPGGANDKWRLKGKGRSSVVIGSLYLQAGLWADSLRELTEGATASRSVNDHLWHGKALELILINLLLLGNAGLEFQIPSVCLPSSERPTSSLPKGDSDASEPSQPKHLRNLQLILPDLLDRILGLYTRISTENLPPLPLFETIIRFCKILSAIHLCEGQLNGKSLEMMVTGKMAADQLTTSPRLTVTPSRQHIVNILFRAFPSSATELLTTADRVSILSGIAVVLGTLGYHRKKAMVVRELVSVLIGGLVEARTRGAAEAGIHPAAGLLNLAGQNDKGANVSALDLGEGDIEFGVEAFLESLCRAYGVIGFDMNKKQPAEPPKELDDSNEAALARIGTQSSTRLYGFSSIKLDILRACINFSEALPDFNGVLKFSSDLMRTAGSGIVPGPRKEDASAMIHRDEQARLVSNITRTSTLVNRIGLSHMKAEYWDEFLLRGVQLEPLTRVRMPVPHARSVLPGATTARASQDVNPFIYNPFLKKPDEAAVYQNLVAGEFASFKVTLQNTYDIEVEIESIKLDSTGVGFEPIVEHVVLGPYRTQLMRLKGRAKEPGAIQITGALVKVKGCRERRFPIFSKPWKAFLETKVKAKGLAALEKEARPGPLMTAPLEVETLSLNVIPEQPLLVVKSTTLPQSSVMILEGERQIFSVTLQNVSSTAVDFMLFSFKDSTQESLQTALSARDATPAELYEYEWILMKKQALRLPKNDQSRKIAPGEEACFEFEILGKPGLTHATIQADYTYLGVPQEELKDQFFTRQLSVDLTVTVNASVELARVDALPVSSEIPQAIWDRLGADKPASANEYCFLSMDLRNAWPSQMAIRVEGENDMVVEDSVLPGNSSRVIIPVKRVFLEDAHAPLPSLNPSRNRQFVVSASQITADMERAGREAFWYREKILEGLKATWRTTGVPKRSGVIELRNIRLSPRMIEAVKIDEVGIDVSVEDVNGKRATSENIAHVDNLFQVKLAITNRTAKPILPMVRLLPALCHRPTNVALDYTRKLAWNGTLQQLLPEIAPRSSTELAVGMTALCRGEFELGASVEEVSLWEDPSAQSMEERRRTQTEELTELEAALAIKQRRIWHSRRPCMLTVRDTE